MPGYFEQFAASVGSIIVSEIGDKTFFIAAIMAMRYERFFPFLGSIAALIIMTVLSCAFGYVIPQLISKKWTILMSMILFYFFGMKMIWDSYKNETHAEEEENEVEMRLSSLESGLLKKNSNSHNETLELDPQKQERQSMTKPGETSPSKIKKSHLFTPKFILGQAFTLTFLAEWGDRSQYTTIALSASYNAFMICFGAILGHTFCTGLAVIFGKLISKKISERVVNLIGGVLFIIFGIVAMIGFLNCCEPEKEIFLLDRN